MKNSILAMTLLILVSFATNTFSQSQAAPPSNLLAKTKAVTQITICWKDNSTDETGFRIEKKTGNCDATSDWEQLAVLDANSVRHNVTGLTPATIYAFRVCAIDVNGNSDFSNCAFEKTGDLGTPPSPTNIKAEPISSSRIRLSWKDCSTNETGFKIYRREGNEAWELFSTTNPDVMLFIDIEANNNTTSNSYRYYVCAYNEAGESPPTYPVIVPNQPLDTSAILQKGIGKTKVTWTDNSNEENGFEIWRKLGSCTSSVEWALAGKVSANKTFWVDPGSSQNITYSYKVRAYKRTGNMLAAYGFSSFSTFCALDAGDDDGNGDANEYGDKFTFSLRQGDFWTYFWTSKSSGSGNASGSFTVTLGQPATIDGTQVFKVEITGDNFGAVSEWTHIGISNGEMLGSPDGVSLETICMGNDQSWNGGGFFFTLPDSVSVTSRSRQFKGNYNEIPAFVIDREVDEGGCEYFSGAGTICPSDETHRINEEEYYNLNIGPIGYLYDSTSTYSGGGYYTYHNTKRTIELIETSLDIPQGITVKNPPWSEAASLNVPRSYPACVVFGGKIYTMGGRKDFSGDPYLDSVEVYDPDTDTWSFVTPLLETVSLGHAFVVSDLIYLFSGDTIFIYDPTKDSWQSKSAPISSAHVAMPSGEIVYISCAWRSYYYAGIYNPYTEDYYRTDNSYYAHRRGASIVAIDFDIYIIGGYCFSDYEYCAKVTRYDFLTDEWNFYLPDMKHAREGAASVTLNGKIIVMGGSGGVNSYVEEFDPATQEWKELPMMLEVRCDHRAVVLDGKIYVIGGRNGSSIDNKPINSVHVYTP